MVEFDAPIPIACTKCRHQVEKTFAWLSDNELLECPACHHDMAGERAAVVEHVRSIRKAIADFAADAGRPVSV
jgi:Zn ribbon nucleic-acid-binding protein